MIRESSAPKANTLAFDEDETGTLGWFEDIAKWWKDLEKALKDAEEAKKKEEQRRKEEEERKRQEAIEAAERNKWKDCFSGCKKVLDDNLASLVYRENFQLNPSKNPNDFNLDERTRFQYVYWGCKQACSFKKDLCNKKIPELDNMDNYCYREQMRCVGRDLPCKQSTSDTNFSCKYCDALSRAQLGGCINMTPTIAKYAKCSDIKNSPYESVSI